MGATRLNYWSYAAIAPLTYTQSVSYQLLDSGVEIYLDRLIAVTRSDRAIASSKNIAGDKFI
ncbi:hypothetical protein [Chamaesiphon sp. GL140_3_metabinner_50]|uniref:hypothetical protein n=1 Tax=Chamaesiphon sp. GL140_3_metabinner_50 TaxID=2970812 RepID=UPI0025D9FDDE|nr:hypothetical protein [Chamaesiphon sp. GL140_3_metabinner_50]